ncbi:hypothetical protein AcV5_002733 [Taiwanofungus camphoratus]|nr:hypothetical protein AcV5_002733 [Antrodia cinnamomea]KAI0924968.1 hypothetical protein AcW2_005687 [Antrodia cinnamomea]KAI0946972.1 hypothetical protein AcV7_009539 [Antrodia cinnamomea]
MVSDEDESVRIAVRALGDMRNSTITSSNRSFQPTPALSITSGTSSPSLPSPSLNGEDTIPDSVATDTARVDRRQGEDGDFVSRVTNFPIVHTAIRAYEQGKASSRVVKYGAEMMESSVKTISRPVIERLPVGQLDEFACRQLDRLENYTRRTPSQDRDRGRSTSTEYDWNMGRSWDTRDVLMSRSASQSRPDGRDPWEGTSTSPLQTQMQSQGQAYSRTPTPRSQCLPPRNYLQSSREHSPSTLQPTEPQTSPSTTPSQPENQVAQRSRWQAMLLEAGGIGAAVSEESMRKLRFCLHWLQYATAHIDAQILVLRNCIASLQPASSNSSTSLQPPPPPTPLSQQHLRTLTAAKRDVVDTLRQVVDVISRHAGGALPEPARGRVRQFILRLPRRWAQAAGVDAHASSPLASGLSTASGSAGDRERDRAERRASAAPYSYGPGEACPTPHSRPPSRTTSPTHSRAHSRQASGTGFGSGMGLGGRGVGGGVPATADAASRAGEKVLTLATESLDMLRSVTAVVGESLDRADAWVERLRVAGLQRQQNVESDTGMANSPLTGLAGPSSHPDGMSNLRELPSHSHPYRDPHPYGASHSSTASSPMSSFASLSASAGISGHASPLHTLSRNSSTTSFGGQSAVPPSYAGYFSGGAVDAAVAEASLDALSLSANTSTAGSRYATPKRMQTGLLPEGDGGGGAYLGGGRGEKRGADADDAAMAAVALAGLAGSAKRARQDRIREDEMDIDGHR